MASTARPTILIIEDEVDLSRLLAFNFKQGGFDVTTTELGVVGIEHARKNAPDLVLLDLMLPDISGSEVCRTLKADAKTRTIPIIMATARGEEVDRIVGFELGADDYVVKPFSMRELVLRARACLRRSIAPPPPPGSATPTLAPFGTLRVDRSAHRVYVNDLEVALTALEFRLVVTMMDRRNRVQSRETLLADVWDLHGDLETRTVDTHVKRVREKLGVAGAYLQTVRGVGYRFAETPFEGE